MLIQRISEKVQKNNSLASVNSQGKDSKSNEQSNSSNSSSWPNNNFSSCEISLEAVIIEGEKSIQMGQSNSDILAKLLENKNSNPILYQSFNQDGKVDRVIVDLQKLEKQQ